MTDSEVKHHMLKRIIGATVAAGAAITCAAVVKLLLDKEETIDDEEENEVRFISLENAKEGTEGKTDAEPKKEAAPEVLEIAGLYPYLSHDFIAEQLSRNAIFNEKYPEDSLITITHKAKFENEQAKSDFIKIGEDNGYSAEVLNEKEASISRKMFTEDGSILSDIYNVANQVACLKGIYEGYNIEL